MVIVAARGHQYTLDGVGYFTIDATDIPAGYSEVDMTVAGRNCGMIDGHVAYALAAKVPGGLLDTLSPAAHWFLVEKKDIPAKKKR